MQCMRRIHASVLPTSRPLSTSAIRQWQNYENERHYEPGEDPLSRIKHGLSFDFRRAKRRYNEAKYDAFRRRFPIAHMKSDVQDYEVLPVRADFLIIGGGLTGSSTAFWLKQGFRDEDLTVVVVENTDNFTKSRSMLGSGVISHQFAVPEMVEMSQYTAEFLRHAGDHFKILDNDPPDINLLPVNFLHLVGTAEEAEKLKETWKMQVSKGVSVAYLTQDELRAKFPFMNFDGVSAGTLGLENEGVFDTWQLLSALREKNQTLGVRYVKGEVENFHFELPDWTAQNEGFKTTHACEMEAPSRLVLKAANVRVQMTAASARPIRFFRTVNCAGPWAGEIATRMGVGSGPGVMGVPIPIVCKRRTQFVIHAPNVPALNAPALVDSSGVYCRPDSVGYNFVCGKNPTRKDIMKKDDQNTDEVDYNMFFDEVYPQLVKRIPAFENAKVINGWNYYEDANTFDDAPILGEHLIYKNAYTMAGFGGYGTQLSIAAAKLYSERTFNEAYSTINVRAFDMRRIMQGNRVEEPHRAV